MGVATVDEEY